MCNMFNMLIDIGNTNLKFCCIAIDMPFNQIIDYIKHENIFTIYAYKNLSIEELVNKLINNIIKQVNINQIYKIHISNVGKEEFLQNFVYSLKIKLNFDKIIL